MIIPAFALGRTQDVLFHLARARRRGGLDPRETVFLDSPMAIDATELYDRVEAEHDEELQALAPAAAIPLAPTASSAATRSSSPRRSTTAASRR